jgi:methylenetetrahydrofolate reductase (NADPH)
VFPNREILQPTIFDHDSFVVWSEEVFQLWTKSWAALYDDETESAALLYEVHRTRPACLHYTSTFVCSSLRCVLQS